MAKSNDLTMLLKANLKQLRLSTMLAEFEKLAREAAAANFLGFGVSEARA